MKAALITLLPQKKSLVNGQLILREILGWKIGLDNCYPE
jgi:hypothetical protein